MSLSVNNGWVSSARQVHSPNFDDRPDTMDVDLVVVNGIMEGLKGICVYHVLKHG